MSATAVGTGAAPVMVSEAEKKKKALDELDTKLAKAEADAVAAEAKFQAQITLMMVLKNGIGDIYSKLDKYREAMDRVTPEEVLLRKNPAYIPPVVKKETVEEDALGDAGVTDANLPQYLGAIEQRAEELLFQYLFFAYEGQGELDPYMKAQTVLRPPIAAVVEKPVEEKKKAEQQPTPATHVSALSGSSFAPPPKVKEQKEHTGPAIPEIAPTEDDDDDDDDGVNYVPLSREDIQRRAVKDLAEQAKAKTASKQSVLPSAKK